MTQWLLQLDQVSFNLPGGRVLFDHLNHTFNTRATGIVGANGCGKSLLGRLLTREQLPTSGIVRREGRVYAVAQRQQRRNARGDRQARDGNQTKLITNAQKERSENSQGKLRLNQQVAQEQQQQRIAEARTRLAQMGIDAGRAMLKTCQLSGGERLKIALAAQLYAQRPPQLLLLDEPDNHLDLPSRIALEQMLNQYQGALIVVSHDGAFLQAIHLDVEFHLDDSSGRYFG
ncbi:ATP-binding cassette domain-containing protein [Pseudomonas sp. Ma2-10]